MAGKWMSSPLLIDGHARQVDDLRTGSNDDILGADSLIVAIKPSNLHLCRGLKASPAFGVGDLHTMRCGRSTKGQFKLAWKKCKILARPKNLPLLLIELD